MVNRVDSTAQGTDASRSTENTNNVNPAVVHKGRRFFIDYHPRKRVAVVAAVAAAVLVGMAIAGAAVAMPALFLVGVIGASVALAVALAAIAPDHVEPEPRRWVSRRPHFAAHPPVPPVIIRPLPPPVFRAPPPPVFHRPPPPVFCAPPPGFHRPHCPPRPPALHRGPHHHARAAHRR